MCIVPLYGNYFPAASISRGVFLSAIRGRRVHPGKIESRPGRKTLLDFYADLKVCHLFGIFHANDMSCQSFILQALLEFVLSPFWSKNLDLCSVTNVRDDLVIIFAEMVPETPV